MNIRGLGRMLSQNGFCLTYVYGIVAYNSPYVILFFPHSFPYIFPVIVSGQSFPIRPIIPQRKWLTVPVFLRLYVLQQFFAAGSYRYDRYIFIIFLTASYFVSELAPNIFH